MAEELVLLTRLFDLLAWLLPKCGALSQGLPPHRDAAPDERGAGLPGSGVRGPERTRRGAVRAHLQDADAALNRLRLYLRLAHRWRWLNDGQYAHVSAQVAEIGKLLGGWIKQSGH